METFDLASRDADREALVPILSHAFGFPAAEVPAWLERAGHENVRVGRRGDEVAGGLIVIPMGQFFGGRSVPMTGIAGVAVAPWARGSGVGTRMMRAVVRELHDAGVALSTLFPATVPLYQRAGYERAGGRWVTSVRPQELPTSHDPAVRFAALKDLTDPALREVYTRFARPRDGWLDRGPYLWSRLDRPARGEPRATALMGPDGLEGYVVSVHKVTDGHDTELTVTDLVALTPRAAGAAMALLGAYRSLANEVRWSGAPHDTFTQGLRERHHRVTLGDFWMLRLTHVAKALEARGYNPSLRGAVHFTVRDEVIPENGATYRVEVEGGAASVHRVSGPEGVTLDVRALATAYAGFRRVSALARDGLAMGDEASVAFADALFASEGPAMSDGF
jgi:predicted acetyltransferase